MKWKIFVVCHDLILDSYYEHDHDFNNENFCFVNVADKPLLPEYYKKYNLIDLKDLKNYTRLGKSYTESEVIYNIYQNKLHEGLDAIGFLHWDKELKTTKDGTYNIVAQINQLMDQNTHLSFETHYTVRDYNQQILADIRQPNKYKGKGTNCYDYILKDYNRFFGTRYSIQDFLEKQVINLCSCFMVPTGVFEKMMPFIASVIESKKLDVFDTKGYYRVQGVFMERYFGLFLCFEPLKYAELTLVHHSYRKTKMSARLLKLYYRLSDVFKRNQACM